MALGVHIGQPAGAPCLPGLGQLFGTHARDVCNSTDLPEVEIISLLEEQLPHYKLRADTIYGYDHDDWLHTPLISPDANIDLTTEQIEETLKYFLLCAERVGQMTKTYNDIDAVTRLLEEKERDLELAARIGQSLLKKNKTLTERNELLEEQVEHIREEVSQLRHELSMKDELLQFYTSAAEESEPESVCSTPLKRNESSSSVQNYFHLDSLQKKLKDLEEENVVLRSEACQLKTETITYEEKEQQLVNDCVKELRDANAQIASISEELAKKTEDAARQQEEITHLLSQIVDLQKKAKACAVENEELVQHLGAAKDAQRQLTAELRELEDKYAECMEMLHEAQEELKNLRNKTMPNTTSRRYHSLGLFPMDSLAAEIEGTMRKELQLEEPESPDITHQKRVFETVRSINQVVKQRSLTPSPMNIPGSNQSSAINSLLSSCVSTPRSSFYGSDVGSVTLDNKTNSIILETEAAELGDQRTKKPGTPGTPGSHDLETALRRLSLRRENYLSERRFFEEEQERKLRELAEKGELRSGSLTPTDSIMSLGAHSRFSELTGFSGMSFSSRSYLPEKLQIVKPLEGSATLHHWQQLAQPHLGGILDPRPGVVTKGFRTLDVDLDEVYCLNDFEEDDTGDHISPPGLATSTPVQHPETSVNRSTTQEESAFRPLRRETKFTHKSPRAEHLPLPGTGSTTGPRILMRDPVWNGPEAGTRCSADQCSKPWSLLSDHLPSRTCAFLLPRPDPAHKRTTLGSACHRPTLPLPSPPVASCILQTSSRGSHQALTQPRLQLVAARAT
nr:trafficking kinesin-binding protein 1 isoform X10 [Oryctolagus cuniculus]